MSVEVFKESKPSICSKAHELDMGTWFVDRHEQVFVVVLDDRTNEKRVLCTGNQYKPFIANLSSNNFEVERVLKTGTLLQISNTISEVK